MRFVPANAACAAASLVLLAACTHATPRAAAPTTTTPPTAAAAPSTYSGVLHAAGTIKSFGASDALTDPIATPFSVTVADPGRGGFRISHALVDGHDDTIVWSGGRPLPVTGTCKLDVGAARLALVPAGAQFSLDGGVRALTAGDCEFGSSVAVGNGGLATSVDSVRFRLTNDAPFKPTGDATVVVVPTRHFEGHSGSAGTVGAFTLTTPHGDTWSASQIGLSRGTWILDITKAANGAWHAEAQFDGDLTIQR